MKHTISAFVAMLLLPIAAAAQQKPILEVGTYAGVTFERLGTNGDKETFTSIDMPQLGIYSAFFPTSHIMLEPEVAFTRESGAGFTATGLGLIGSVAYAFSGVTANTFYLAPAGVVMYAKADSDNGLSESFTDYAAGMRAGYRVTVKNALALRFEGAYLRKFPEEGENTNLFVFRVGIGGVLPGGTIRTAAR